MILDNIKNCEMYYSLNSGLEKAFLFINNYIKNPLDCGKYDIDGKNVFATVIKGPLKDKGRLESHKKYIDIQFIAEGEEIMAVIDSDLLKIEESLLEAKDVIFYEDSDLKSNIKFRSGDFAIFFPQDAHEPGLKSNSCEMVTKIVVKVLA